MWYYCLLAYISTYQNHWYFFWINISGCSVNRISTDYILDPAARHRRRWKGRRWSSDCTLKLAKIEVSSIARQVLHSYNHLSSVHGTMLTAGLSDREATKAVVFEDAAPRPPLYPRATIGSVGSSRWSRSCRRGRRYFFYDALRSGFARRTG